LSPQGAFAKKNMFFSMSVDGNSKFPYEVKGMALHVLVYNKLYEYDKWALLRKSQHCCVIEYTIYGLCWISHFVCYREVL